MENIGLGLQLSQTNHKYCNNKKVQMNINTQ